MKLLLIALAIVVSLLYGADKADADTRYIEKSPGCVTTHELWTTPSLPKSRLERRWEVKGKGIHADTFIGSGWLYPICGHKAYAYAHFTSGWLSVVGRINEGNL